MMKSGRRKRVCHFFRFRPSVDIQNSKLLEPVAKLGVISYNTGIRSYGQKVWCQNRGKRGAAHEIRLHTGIDPKAGARRQQSGGAA